MSAARKQKLTVAEYLAIEARAEFKSEYYNGEMFAMAGASEPHNRIKGNTEGELYARLKGGPCRTYSSDQRVHVEATGLYTYPDILVVCGPSEFAAEDKHAIINPRTIIEVLSPSTAHYDRGAKLRQYQKIPTLQEYVMIYQDEAVCERLTRQADESWTFAFAAGLDTTLTFTSLDVDIPLAEIYAGVTFPEVPAPPQHR
jgi:Uma2 family endonuclease